MSNIVQSGIEKRKHRCHRCGKEAPWDDNWSWWGSLLTEDCGDILKICSDDCRSMVHDPEAMFKRVFGRSVDSKFYKR